MFEKILSSIGVSLKKHDIPYMIIGGQAVLLYGEPRLTRNIDITLKPLPKDLDIVLILEALDVEFVNAFWGFIKEGHYKNRQKLHQY